MEISYSTPKAALKTARILSMALIGGIVLFNAVVFFVLLKDAVFIVDPGDIFFTVIIALSAASFPAGFIAFRMMTAKITREKKIKQRFAEYQTALIVRLALFEGVGLFSTVITLVSQNIFYSLFTALSLLLMAGSYPQLMKLRDILKMSQEEYELFI